MLFVLPKFVFYNTDCPEVDEQLKMHLVLWLQSGVLLESQ